MSFKKIRFAFLSVAVAGALSFAPLNCLSVQAKNSSVLASNSGKVQGEVLSKEIYVSDVFELLQAVDNIAPWGKIFIKNDINMLGMTLCINKSLVLDLNGHNIIADQNSGGIVIESKHSVTKNKIIKEYSSSYVWDDKKHKVKKPFFGGDGYKLTVVDYEYADEYDDNIYVTIKNGSINRCPGKNGDDGTPGTWLKCSGEPGETPNAPLNVNSGVLSLINVKVKGGNGGNGGNGAHYPWAHLPFSGGCGADGGKGGNGGSAISVLRCGAKVIADEKSKISAGDPGKGGKGGEPSSNYWFYKSKPGSAGKTGKSNPEIEYKYKKSKK